jgi:23S rRNA pseudouridine1911/1915/1917 synthase
MKKKKETQEPQEDLKPQVPKIPKIIAETEDYLVIDKPAGILAHAVNEKMETGGQQSIVSWLLERYPDIRNVGEDPLRPGIVHRLDKDVSGLMVVAKNNNAFENLKEQFQKRRTIKEYVGLVFGKVAPDDGDINFPIKRSTAGFKMAAVPANFIPKDNETVRQALTSFVVERRFHNYTLLKLVIKTGRTHQIRVHLQALGYPLVGDELYSTKNTRVKNKKLGLGRVFLVSKRLEFDDLSGVRQKFEIDLPSELSELLNKIK